ncbi:MAG: sigma-70 family RNA polymerase sigma factor [Chitinophagaceae bacterium]|nr:sigma-70 family RNA polymerase sigma factor [Chitinophagaceae bacterium]
MMKVERSYTDDELVDSIERGKDLNGAILYIYQQYSDSVSSFIKNHGGSVQDAEDVFQETVVAFLNIIKNGKYRKESSVKTFLVSVAKNIWYNEIKKRESSYNREKIFETSRDLKEADVSHYISDREMKQQFRDLLNQLDESCRKILLLFYYENLSMKEMVDYLPYENEQVVRNKKYKCLQHLTGFVKQNPSMIEKLKATNK